MSNATDIEVHVDRAECDDEGCARLVVNTNLDYETHSDDWNKLVSTIEAAPQLRQYVESFCLVLEECWKDKSLTAPRSAQCQLGTMVDECRKLLANA